ncbi:hypothetical protein [Ulvibacter litoralis]|uniref:Lipoprotein n=1 Tax=Ulvibacter litoralis TaxID=227084 RepID=A0A1G7I004_9FLAO|nr:hypothetical protein [Ulvibacter litoralis]GHC62993.1 hypothetical protein GCM10008083_30350 [Ulvibacter litoralis]SDF05786.1 hypothetical protein SAMN05421855_10515 [Ulvibacter litoralis]
MKTHFNYFLLLFSCLAIVACNTTSEKKEVLEKNSEKVEKKSYTIREDAPTTNDTSESTPDESKLTLFMNSEMKDWKPIPKSMWLQQDFIDNYNTTSGIEEKIDYDKNTFIKGDFNGNGFNDYAQFLLNPKDEVVLMAFHQTQEGYDTFEIVNYGTAPKCCLGAGISVTPPGIYKNTETNTDVTVESDALIYSIYEKSDRIWYFNGERYGSFLISD